MADHILVVEGDREDGFVFSIECLVPGGQHGWEECGQDHAAELAAYRATATLPHEPDADCDAGADCECEWADGDELLMHGIVHEYSGSYGWTTPFPGCVVADQVSRGADWDAADIAADHGAGRWLVEDDWSDDDMRLDYVGPADPYSLPDSAGTPHCVEEGEF